MDEPRETLATKLLELFPHQAVEHVLILLAPDGRIVYWPSAAQKVFGYEPAEVLDHWHGILFTPEDIAQGAPEKELEIARRGVEAEDDRWMLRQDGLRFWATGALQALREAGGEIVGFAKVLRNRTDLKSQLETLENEVKSLERSSERKNTFISTLAHELRNPLSALTNGAELLEDPASTTEEGTFALALVRRQLDLMRRMVDDLLDITRITSGKLKLVLRETTLDDILSAAADVCRPLIEPAGTSFTSCSAKNPSLSRRTPAGCIRCLSISLKMPGSIPSSAAASGSSSSLRAARPL